MRFKTPFVKQFLQGCSLIIDQHNILIDGALSIYLLACLSDIYILNDSHGNVQEEGVSFKHILAAFPNECKASTSVDAISPHLCFICLLHLANEHELRIQGCHGLDDLSIQLETHERSS